MQTPYGIEDDTLGWSLLSDTNRRSTFFRQKPFIAVAQITNKYRDAFRHNENGKRSEWTIDLRFRYCQTAISRKAVKMFAYLIE